MVPVWIVLVVLILLLYIVILCAGCFCFVVFCSLIIYKYKKSMANKNAHPQFTYTYTVELTKRKWWAREMWVFVQLSAAMHQCDSMLFKPHHHSSRCCYAKKWHKWWASSQTFSSVSTHFHPKVYNFRWNMQMEWENERHQKKFVRQINILITLRLE